MSLSSTTTSTRACSDASQARGDVAHRGTAVVNAGDLATQFDLSRPAVAEHLQVLRRAALVRDEQVGRQRLYHLEAAPLEQISEGLKPFERFWRDRLRSMAELLENEEDPP